MDPVHPQGAAAPEILMSLLVRLLLVLAAPVTAMFVARDSLNFGIIQTLVATVIAAIVVIILAFWPYIRKAKPDL